MKPIAFILVLTSAAIFGRDPPRVTSAAKVKPSSKWEDHPTRLASSLPGYKPTTDGELSTYGGLKRERHKATGFFHARKSGKRWWLVDPEGHPFIHVGVVAVSPPEGNKTPPDWAEATSNLLHDHGFNGTGAWSENERIRAGKRPVVYTKIYHQWSPNPEQVENWVEWSGKPFIVTEWYAKGMDSGMANTTGAGFVVKTQADRGRFYQNFTLGLLESRGCVGWHWFKYRDNDPNAKGADPSNIDSNKGIVNLALEPYVPLMQAMHELNRQVYSLADYFDREDSTSSPATSRVE